MESKQIDRTIPFNEDAEKSVLGAVLLDSNNMSTIQEKLKTDDFYKRAHRMIFNAMEIVHDQNGGIVDPVPLMEQLDAHDELTNVGGSSYILDLANFTPSAGNIEQYISIVRDKSILRQLISASEKISMDAYTEKKDISVIIDSAERRIMEIGEDTQSDRPQKIKDLILQANERLIELMEQDSEIVGLPSGYIDLDRVTKGFHPDQFIVIAARPAVGKTAFALNIAQNVATKEDTAVAVFSLEMSALDMVFRMLSAEGNILASNMQTGKLTSEEWSSFTVAMDTLEKAEIYIDDSSISIVEIRAKCRRLKLENPNLGLIIIDYLQLIEGTGQENRQQEVSAISRQLKQLAMELQVPVIALSQLSRGVEQRQNKRPMLSDIRESGSIEQDADVVAFLYRNDYHQHEDEDDDREDEMVPDNTVEVIIAKNRRGANDTVRLLFARDYNKFSSLSYVPEPQY